MQCTVVVPSANVLPLTGEHTTDGDAVTASVADAVNVTTAPAADRASAVMLTGHRERRRDRVAHRDVERSSRRVARAILERQCTVVVPTANTLPLSGEHITAGDGVTASVAEAVNDTALPAAACRLFNDVRRHGESRRGRVRTVTVNDASLALPATSCAEQNTPVWPSGNTLPLAGAHVTGTIGSRLSVAVGVS